MPDDNTCRECEAFEAKSGSTDGAGWCESTGEIVYAGSQQCKLKKALENVKIERDIAIAETEILHALAYDEKGTQLLWKNNFKELEKQLEEVFKVAIELKLTLSKALASIEEHNREYQYSTSKEAIAELRKRFGITDTEQKLPGGYGPNKE